MYTMDSFEVISLVVQYSLAWHLTGWHSIYKISDLKKTHPVNNSSWMDVLKGKLEPLMTPHQISLHTFRKSLFKFCSNRWEHMPHPPWMAFFFHTKPCFTSSNRFRFVIMVNNTFKREMWLLSPNMVTLDMDCNILTAYC